MMKLILTSVDDDLAQAWRRFCSVYNFVEIYEGSILDVTCDAIVSPANSFGFMDGGIDARYQQRFGHQLQEKVQALIAEKHGGELVVGQADLVETMDPTLQYLIIAPTMRVPMILRDSVNPYLATRAVLRLVQCGLFDRGQYQGTPISQQIQSIALPGMGTGVGQVSPNLCARQVAQAIEDVVLERYEMPRTWAEASTRHQELTGGRHRRLQSELE
jgi:O-acetyl-ADP-ribose deacetylase (regulator of RNase III)